MLPDSVVPSLQRHLQGAKRLHDQALEHIRAQHRRYRQLAFDFNFDT